MLFLSLEAEGLFFLAADFFFTAFFAGLLTAFLEAFFFTTLFVAFFFAFFFAMEFLLNFQTIKSVNNGPIFGYCCITFYILTSKYFIQ